MRIKILMKALVVVVVLLFCIAWIPSALSAPGKSDNNGKSNAITSSWDTSLYGWSMCETYYTNPAPGVGIVGSDGNQLSLRAAQPNYFVTLYRNARMTPSDTFQVSVYNGILNNWEEWHLNAIRIGCNESGGGIIAQWWGSSFAPAVGPHPYTGIQSINWGMPQTADMLDLPHGQWYDIKMVCNKTYVTSYYKLSSDTTWTLVSCDPIGDKWKGGYIGVTGNYHGAYFKDFQIYKTKK